MGRKRRVELTPPVARYEQLAALLRQRIFSGVYVPGSALPSGPALAADPGLNISQHSVQKAFELLERDGLVVMVSGSGTKVLPRHRYAAGVDVRWTLDDDVTEKTFAAAADAVAAAEAQDPAISAADLSSTADVLTVTMIVEASHAGFASAQAMALVRAACGAGWDLAGASVEAHPAGGDDT
jgi:DNA-binding GntR family transcriptional regulator